MSTAKTYTPQKDSLASQVCGFFQNNPDEELTLEDITDKFMASRGNIHTCLRLAYEAGMLTREHNPDGDYIYKAGPKLHQIKPLAPDVPAPVTKPKWVMAPTRADMPLPKLEDVVIQDDVPMPDSAYGRRDWTPLLAKLQPTQSFALPLRAQATLRKQITAAQKANKGEFKVKTYPDSSTLRVWRVA